MPTTFTSGKNTSTVNQRVAGVSCAILNIDPSTLASYPGAADIIEYFDLPVGARVVGGFLRTGADIGAGSSTVKLQAKPSGGSAVDLTSTLSAESASSIAVSKTLPAQTVVTTIQVLVGTAALDAAGALEVIVLYSM